MTSGYVNCYCCDDIFVAEYEDEHNIGILLCDGCVKADCPETGDCYCQIPQCFECCNGDGPRASLMSDGKWHSNCDDDCVNAGKSWES
jgi:hypothetical protein